jgi:hypothetical protein
MFCIAHHVGNRRNRSAGGGFSRRAGRVLCFECYRARLDRPERLRMSILTFPRLLTGPELEHRRRMLAHLGSTDRASSPLQSA